MARHLQQDPSLLGPRAPREDLVMQIVPKCTHMALVPPRCATTGEALDLSGPLAPHLPDDVDWDSDLPTLPSTDQ